MGVPSGVGYRLSRGLGLELWNEGFIAGDETVEQDKDERLKVQRHLALGTKKKVLLKANTLKASPFPKLLSEIRYCTFTLRAIFVFVLYFHTIYTHRIIEYKFTIVR